LDPVVLQVIPELDAGGAERTTVDIAKAIVAAGGRALVASRGGRLEEELAEAGGELIRLDMKSKNPFSLWRNARRLAAVVRAEGVDVVHARSRAPAWSALMAARATGTPFVTTYHGTYNAKTPLKRFYNSVMARGDVVIANSRFIAERIRSEHGIGDDRIVVIARGTDLETFDRRAIEPERIADLRRAWRAGVEGERFVILLPGRLTRWKGQAVAIEALAGFGDFGEAEPLLVLVGDDQGRTGYREELERLAEGLRIADRVRFAGHCSDMPAAYAVADVVLSTSIEPEAFGRVAAEAQIMGKPVIASDHGGARETVEEGQGGWRIPPGDPDALAAALRQVAALSPEERRELGQRGAARARREFSVEAMQSATMSVYERVLREAR
jgi:glycosyltransferase involved in cell wall biosynthesis